MDAMAHYRLIRQQVADLVAGSISFDQFKSRYVPVLWSIGLDAPEWLREVSGCVDLALAEYSNHHRSWPELLALLHAAAAIPPTETLTIMQAGPDRAREAEAGQSPRVVTLAVTLQAA